MRRTEPPRLNGALPQYQLVEGQLWQHSVTASLAAEQIIRLSPVALPAEVATAALIHDIDKLVISQYLDAHVLHFDLDADRTDRRPISHTESAILDVDHSKVGALAAEHWGLPDTIRRGIAFHHTPEQDGSPLCFAVHLAELLATEVHQSPEDRELASEDADRRDQALRVLVLNSGSYESLAAKIGEQYEALATAYAVIPT